MGTNFYLRRKLSPEDKQKAIELINEDKYEQLEEMLPKEIHIGKRSAGWKFLWNANNFEYFKPTKESLIEFLHSGDIYDEYDRYFTYDEFWNDEIKNFIDEEGLWDIKKYYIDYPKDYKYYEDSSTIRRFKKEFGVNANRYGEFYIDNLRFTTCDSFS